MRSLLLGGENRLTADSLIASGPKIALWDKAGSLLRGFLAPESIESGTLLLAGREPALALASGLAAYVPQNMPLPPSVKVLEALSLSAHLLGLGKSDAERSLARCQVTALGKKKLGELTRLQMRLVCLAHGLIGSPQILLLENLFHELDEPESAIVEALLEVELEHRSCLIACASDDPGSRTIALGCHEAISTAGDHLLPPTKPRAENAPGYWVSCISDVGPLTELLKSQGVEVARSPRTSVCFVKSTSGAAIFRAAKETGVGIVELTPSGVRRDSP